MTCWNINVVCLMSQCMIYVDLASTFLGSFLQLWLKFLYFKNKICYLNWISERKVCKTTGSAAQLSPYWHVDVSQQLPCFERGEAQGPEVHCGSAYQHYLLSDEGAGIVKSSSGQHSGERLCQSMPSFYLSVPVWELLWALQQGISGLFCSEPGIQKK